MKKGDIIYKAQFSDKENPEEVSITQFTVDRVQTFKTPRALITTHPTLKDKVWLTVGQHKAPIQSVCTTEKQAYEQMDKALENYNKHIQHMLQTSIKQKEEATKAVEDIQKRIEENKELEYKRAISVRKALAAYK